MRKKLIDKINKENEVLCVNKKEVKNNLTIGEEVDIQYKFNSENISLKYNLSGIGGFALKNGIVQFE